MFVFENLLRNEYFPNELPPCFHSESFADNHEKIKDLVQNESIKPSDPLTFSGYKNVNSRRKFAIPNPYQYANAAHIIANNSAEIFSILKKGKCSLTVPLATRPSKDESYKKPVKKIAESKEKINKIYQNNLYEIRLDIQTFFDSVYTHSVAWAMHSKSIAKKNKQDLTLVGNKIDRCLQNLNSGQTNGILVGNAISRIVSEIILCCVDNAVKSRNSKIVYLRYVDDYYIFVKESSQINDTLAIFRQELAKFELSLNENKLHINESPFLYGKSWVEQMRLYANFEPQLLLEKAIIEYHCHKDIAILKYALRVLRGIFFKKLEWEIVQPMILNIWVRFPSLSSIIAVILKNNAMNVSGSMLKKSIYAILNTHVVLKNDEEVIWAVWLSKVFDIKLSQKYIELILSTENWLAIIIILDVLSSRKSETVIKKTLNQFREHIIEEYFSSANPADGMLTDIWLLAYEADKNKWLNLSGSETFLYARKHPFFKKLRELDIDFYNGNYTYDIIGKSNSKSNIFVTRKELIDILKDYKDLTDVRRVMETPSPAIENIEESLYKKIVDALANTLEY